MRKIDVFSRNKHVLNIKFRDPDFKSKTIREQIQCLKEIIPEIALMSETHYRNSIKKILKAKYSCFERIQIKESMEKGRNAKLIVGRLLCETLRAGSLVLYMDISSVNETSFRKKCWHVGKNRNKLNLRSQVHNIKIVAIISELGVESIQFLRRVDQESLLDFLRTSLETICALKRPQNVVLFIDNARIFKTQQFRKLTGEFKLLVIHNAVGVPQINLVEQLFEFLKRAVRLKLHLKNYDSVWLMLEQLKRFSPKVLLSKITKQYQEFAKIIQEAAEYVD